MRANADIRAEAKRNGVFLWEIAIRYGVNDGNFSRKLRKELPPEEKEKIVAIIQELAREHRGGAENGN